VYDRTLQLTLDVKQYITTFAPAADGAFWVGLSDSSLILLRDSTITLRTKLRFGIPVQIVHNKGVLLVRTFDHIVTMSETEPGTQKLFQYTNEKGIPPGTGFPILLDREDNLWIGSWLNGLHKVADRSFIHVPLESQHSPVNQLAASADANGHIWVGSMGGVWEFYRNEGDEWKRSFHPLMPGQVNNPSHNDQFHRLWVTLPDSWKQIRCYDVKATAQAPSRLSLRHTLHRGMDYEGAVLSLSVDGAGRVWMTSSASGPVVLTLSSKAVHTRYRSTTSLPVHHIPVTYHDADGSTWLGTFSSGLYVISTQDGRPISRFTKGDGLPGDYIRAIFRDSDGQMWIGTRHDGLALMTEEGFRTISMRDGLASNAIWFIREDTQGRLWLLTDVGLLSIDRKTLRPLPTKPELTGEVLNSFGIHKNEFLWCKGPGGLTIMDFSKESNDLTPPLVHIKSIEASGALFSPEEKVELAYNQNTLSIDFVGISFRNEKGVRYRYRMLGVDTAWSKPSSQRRVTFATLNPGSYRFEVEAFNADGVPSARPAEAFFVIIPPFWQRWWFMGIVSCTVAFILWTLYRYRVSRILEMERLRVRIASDLHDDVGTNLSSIQVASQIMERQGSLSDQDRAQLKEIGAITASTQEMMRDIVWMLNPKNDTLDDFMLRMKEVAARLLPEVRHTFIAPGGKLLDKVSIDFKRNVFLIFKEALNNIVRHAGATETVIRVEHADGLFVLAIKDNGKGFETDEPRKGNGLANIRRRAEQLGGSVEIASKKGGGTAITLRIKNHANA
jgi:signal transduction histidine kinase